MGVCAIGALGCTKGFQDRYGPFYILSDSTVYSKGDMGSRIDKQFDRMMDDYPGIQSITLRGCCPGSRNDEKMYIAARKLRSYGIAAILTNASMNELCTMTCLNVSHPTGRETTSIQKREKAIFPSNTPRC